VLRTKRLGSMEAFTLLRTVIAEIDVAIFAFDHESRLKLVNIAGERLLDQPSERLLTKTAEELDMQEFLHAESAVLQHTFPGHAGRWGIRTRAFREDGLPHTLLVMTDLTRALREEELQAWKRLVRVLGHELNNSLAPIQSIAGSLRSLVARDPLPDDWKSDTLSGLGIIESRSESLARFLEAYSRLARLPAPNKGPVAVEPWIRRIAAMELRTPIRIVPGPAMNIPADATQLDQLLINLLRNASEASSETGGAVELGWRNGHGALDVWVRDEGLGIANPANLFVPFFTTKPGGSGIGLVLSRQIAEAHGGTLTLENRPDRTGCEALLHLPL
jgi:two-component system nitrogen regulation sensor histidine kinase NtrY